MWSTFLSLGYRSILVLTRALIIFSCFQFIHNLLNYKCLNCNVICRWKIWIVVKNRKKLHKFNIPNKQSRSFVATLLNYTLMNENWWFTIDLSSIVQAFPCNKFFSSLEIISPLLISSSFMPLTQALFVANWLFCSDILLTILLLNGYMWVLCVVVFSNLCSSWLQYFLSSWNAINFFQYISFWKTYNLRWSTWHVSVLKNGRWFIPVKILCINDNVFI